MRFLCSLIQKTIECINCKSKGISVYMFHQVTNDIKQWENKNCCITADGFKNFVNYLVEKKYKFISLNQLAKEEVQYEKEVIFTFDDVYEDAYNHAFPILIEKKIPFCVFICENFLGKQGYITNKQFEELLDEPFCTIGYHTKNHELMRRIPVEKIDYEVDCQDFEKQIQRKIYCFAFPYGSLYACSRKSIALVKEKSYKLIFSTISSLCTQRWRKRHYEFLPRINVNEKNYMRIIKKLK